MALSVAVPVFLTGCQDNTFKISGNVQKGNDSTLYLERGVNGRWLTLDSAKIGNEGNFAISYEAPETPDIFRLRLGQRYIYFPIDSLENVKLQTSLEKFGNDFTLSGSEQAVKFSEFEKDAMKCFALSDMQQVKQMKKMIYNKYIKDDHAGLLSYYIITKTIAGHLFFNPENPDDAKMYVAVATAYKNFKPSDPRTKMLEQAAIDLHRARYKAEGKQNVMHANSSALVEVELNDINGRQQKLSSIAANGKPTILVFGVLTGGASPEINRALYQIYNGGNVNIYHVCYDSDELAWRQVAKNLPWTTVYEPKGNNSRYLIDYNVAELPTFFIYNRAGELIDRAATIQELNSKVAGI